MSVLTKTIDSGSRITKKEDVLLSTELPSMRKIVKGDEITLHNKVKDRKEKAKNIEVKDDKLKAK
jgi:hypothetical protein